MEEERDAFGRTREESSPSWPGADPPPADPSPASASPASAPPASASAPPPRRPRRSLWPLMVMALVLLVVAGAAALFVGTTGISSSSSSSVSAEPEAAAVPGQVRQRSYLTAAGLRAGLRVLSRDQPGRVTNFSVRRERINLQVRRGGRNHIVQLAIGAEVADEVASTSVATDPGSFAYEALDPGAPVRLMRAANRRLRESPAGVDYYLASRFGDRLQWGVYYKSGKIAIGDSRGRFVRRIS